MAQKDSKKAKAASKLSKLDWGKMFEKTDSRMIFSLIILVFFVLIIAVSVHPLSPFRPPVVYVDSFEIGVEESNISIQSYLSSKTVSDFPEELLLETWSIALHPDLAAGAHKACLDLISARIRTATMPLASAYSYPKFSIEKHLDEPVCVEYVAGAAQEYSSFERFTIEWDEDIGTSYIDDGGYYSYPYDSLTFSANFMVSGRLFDKSNIEIGTFHIPVDHALYVQMPEWQIRAMQVDTGYEGEPMEPGIQLKRSLLIRILTPLMFVMIFVITIVILYVENLSSAIELMLVLILGIWGVRQIILPNDFPGITAVDMILLGEYGAIALVLIARIVMNAKEKKRV